MSFIFLEYFGISRWEELFFFRTNFFCQRTRFHEEKRATLSLEKNELRGIFGYYFFYFRYAIITFIFFEIHTFPPPSFKREKGIIISIILLLFSTRITRPRKYRS